MKVTVILLSLAAAASARMPYVFSDGYLDILGVEPAHNFDCTDRPYGYYADVETDCKVFHVCLPVPDETGYVVETAHFSFFCGNMTIFDQEAKVCNHEEDAFPCSEAETLYELSNADFGRIPEGDTGGAPIVFPEAAPTLRGIEDVPEEAPVPLGRSSINVDTPAETPIEDKDVDKKPKKADEIPKEKPQEKPEETPEEPEEPEPEDLTVATASVSPSTTDEGGETTVTPVEDAPEVTTPTDLSEGSEDNLA